MLFTGWSSLPPSGQPPPGSQIVDYASVDHLLSLVVQAYLALRVNGGHFPTHFLTAPTSWMFGAHVASDQVNRLSERPAATYCHGQGDCRPWLQAKRATNARQAQRKVSWTRRPQREPCVSENRGLKYRLSASHVVRFDRSFDRELSYTSTRC